MLDCDSFCSIHARKFAESEPAASLEEQVGHRRGQDHEPQRERIAQRPTQLRHELEVHAIDRSDQGRRQEHHGGYREDLDDLVLLEVDQPERRIEQEGDLVRQESGVVAERGGVTLQNLDLLLAVARRFLVLEAARLVKADEAADRDQTLAGESEDIALLADALDQRLQVAGLAGGLG